MDIGEIKESGTVNTGSMIIRSGDRVTVHIPETGKSYLITEIMTIDTRRGPGDPDGPGRTIHHLMADELSESDKTE